MLQFRPFPRPLPPSLLFAVKRPISAVSRELGREGEVGGKGERENKEGVARRRLEKTRASFLEVLARPGSRIHNTTMDQKALQKFGELHWKSKRGCARPCISHDDAGCDRK